MKLGKLPLIVGGVTTAMLVEGVVLFFMLSGGKPAPAPAEGDGAAPTEAVKPVEIEDKTAEVLIDNFNTTNSKAAPGSVIHVSMKLTAITPEGQSKDFEELANKTYKTRVRQVVERLIRGATMEELQDPSLSTLRRMIKEDINKLLSKSMVLDSTVSDFRLIEQ